MLLPWLTLFDLRGAFSNFVETKEVNYKHKCDDFAILVPIFNDIKYLTNTNFLKKYKNKVVLCTTNIETEEFYKDLQKIANRYGFKIMGLLHVSLVIKSNFAVFSTSNIQYL